jgi:Fe-Mn family superoxide dismutase
MGLRTQESPFDPTALRGLSPRLITSHHANDDGGVVKRLGAIRAQLAAVAFPAAPGFQLNGLKREELIATNPMLLHELYFASLGGDGATMEPAMALALQASFGSVARWRDGFVACAKALGGGSGWMRLAFEPREGTVGSIDRPVKEVS